MPVQGLKAKMEQTTVDEYTRSLTSARIEGENQNSSVIKFKIKLIRVHDGCLGVTKR